MTTLHEQARAEAEKRYPNRYHGSLKWTGDRVQNAYVDGFLAGHEAATRRHDPRCISLTESEFNDSCDCLTWLAIEKNRADTAEGLAQTRARDESAALLKAHQAIKRAERAEAATRTRVVATVAELDELPVGSVVLDAHDNPWGHPRDGLASWVDLEANEDALLWWSATRIDLPARVLYEPEEES